MAGYHAHSRKLRSRQAKANTCRLVKNKAESCCAPRHGPQKHTGRRRAEAFGLFGVTIPKEQGWGSTSRPTR